VTDDVQTDDKRPASKRVADELLARIDAGTYAVGDRLPTVRQITEEFGVAQNTAHATVKLLRDAGAITGKPNSVARVRDRSVEIDPAEEVQAARASLADLRSELQRLDADAAKVDDRLANLADRLGR
jgi:DNA-binding transcriptional regulator YhcF (GntR family)